MKRVLLLFFLHVLLVSGCGDGEEVNFSSITGLISAKEGSRILVIENVTQEQLEQFEIDEILNKGLGSAAIWFEVEDQQLFDDLRVGEKVLVEYDMVAESYPGQSKAINIRRLEE
ncbi:hypothetical protein BTR23_06680 [Alkalihalophilus pseudofirmus]|uniref:DUF3221 domain-containing protein n=1 Tax=Alkalihalobacterium alkalinitrilicum TaxID=427920 RepID=UPI00094C8EDE|nr:DUF3221 domain-containing protein [Alkalihalobacterium alkalinitrilicum]OLO40662.1 hypothetical protein BTR23_06680 [Alkalihalophilus pseudofirmus]